jgi:hypothetical protein
LSAPFTAATAAARTSGGPSKSGAPWPRLTALCRRETIDLGENRRAKINDAPGRNRHGCPLTVFAGAKRTTFPPESFRCPPQERKFHPWLDYDHKEEKQTTQVVALDVPSQRPSMGGHYPAFFRFPPLVSKIFSILGRPKMFSAMNMQKNLLAPNLPFLLRKEGVLYGFNPLAVVYSVSSVAGPAGERGFLL